MKLYNHPLAPNPRRVRFFAAEKKINLPTEDVDIFSGASRSPEFLKKNPAGGVPVLQLDDGSYLAESVAICRYLESLHPDNNLMGRDAREQAEIEQWNRRIELNLFGAIGRTMQHTSPIFAGRLTQVKEYGETQRAATKTQLEWLDAQLAGREYIAGPRFTIADITAVVAIDLGKATFDLKVDPALKNVTRWYEKVSSRPSAKV